MKAWTKSIPWLQIGLHSILLSISALYISLGITRALNIYDEGLILYGAQRVLWGQVPYRDFWTVYGPGQFYALAGLFRVFGSSVLVERIWDTLFRAGLALVCYLLAKRLAPRPLALVVWAVVTAWMGFYEFYGYPVYIALFFVLLSIFALLRLDRAVKVNRWLVVAGLMLGVATLFRHDFGVYAFAAEMVVLIPLALRTDGLAHGSHPIRRLLGLLLPYIVGAAVIILPALLLLLLAVTPATLWNNLVAFPATVFPSVRALPYPKLLPDPRLLVGGISALPKALPVLAKQWPYYFPYLVTGLTALYLLVRVLLLPWHKLARTQAVRLGGYALLTLFAAASISQSRIRADLIHMVQLLIVSFVQCIGLVGLAWRAWKPAGITALLVALVLLTPFFQQTVEERQQLFKRGIWASAPNTDHQIPAAWGMPVDPDQAAAVKYVQRSLPEDALLYVGLSRHDRIFVNDALFYFLAQRKSATRYNELHPGVATTQAVQEEIVADLDRLQVPLVVIFSMFEGVIEPNDSGKSSGVNILDRYLKHTYQPGASFGRYYRILIR
ncbi:MAG: glycosyltransferase family protein [Anaerolineae bacterium]